MREIEHLVRFSIVFIFFFSSVLSAQVYPDKNVDKYLRSGIKFILDENYSAAESQFIRLKNEYPELPFGNVYLAATEIAKSLDFYKPFNEDLIFLYLDSASELSDKLFEKNDTLIWHLYFKALSAGYYAYFQAMRGNYFSAISKGINSINDYNECLKLNPKFYEAFIAIGTFNYWSSSKTLGLKWLPFVKDNSSGSISILENAISKPVYNKYLAAYSLCWIYIDNNEPGKSIKLAKSILSEYPKSRLFMWVLANGFKRTDKTKAVEIYNNILNSFNALPDSLPVVKIILKHKIAMLLFDLKKYDSAKELCNEIILMKKSLNENEFDIVEERLDRVIKLKGKIIDILSKRR